MNHQNSGLRICGCSCTAAIKGGSYESLQIPLHRQVVGSWLLETEKKAIRIPESHPKKTKTVFNSV
jgi:hypothetical protein